MKIMKKISFCIVLVILLISIALVVFAKYVLAGNKYIVADINITNGPYILKLNNISPYGIADIYINDKKIASSVTSFNESYKLGTRYEIKIIANSGYNYTGISSGELSGTINTNKTISASFSKNTYSISYELDGGNITGQTTTYSVDSESFTLPQPTKKGYTFDGWIGTGLTTKTKSVTISKGTTGNKTYTANWNANTYTITFNANGGSGEPSSQSYIYATSGTTQLSSTKPTRKGYTFLGWSLSSAATTATYSAGQSWGLANANNYVLYAVWRANTYSVKFDSNGGTGTMSNETAFTYGTAKQLTANSFTRTGYQFNGWNTKSDGTGTTYANKANMTTGTITDGGIVILYAQWKGNSYTIKFNSNGGTGTMSNLSMTYGSAKTLTANSFTKEYYTFTGWNTKANGTGTTYTNKKSVNNLTTTSGGTINLYAQWRKNKVTIYYHANGGVYGSGGTGAGMNGKKVGATPEDPLTPNYSYEYDSKILDGDTEQGHSIGLKDYVYPDSTWYLVRSGYEPTYKYALNSASSSIKIGINDLFSKITDFANKAGKLSDLKKGDVAIHVYCLWTKL